MHVLYGDFHLRDLVSLGNSSSDAFTHILGIKLFHYRVLEEVELTFAHGDLVRHCLGDLCPAH